MASEFPRAGPARGNSVPSRRAEKMVRPLPRGAPPTSPPRIAGIDIARGLAIIGMLVSHAIPRPDDAELIVDGRSSVLFAVLAGVSLGLMTGGGSPLPRGRRADAVQATMIRALALLVLGTTLTLVYSEVAIILDYYAVMFVLLLPVLFAPRWLLAVVATVIAVGAPLIADRLPPFDDDAMDLASAPAAYLFTGYYPAVIWLPFLCVGLICARSVLTRHSTQYAMVVLGFIATVVGYGAAALLPGVDATAHSGSTAELVGSGGLAIAIIGALVPLASAAGSVGGVVRITTWPIAAAGTMALSVYTAQVCALGIAASVRDASGAIDYPGWPLLIALIVVSLLGASLWRRTFGQGPLERILSLLTRSRPRSTSRLSSGAQNGTHTVIHPVPADPAVSSDPSRLDHP